MENAVFYAGAREAMLKEAGVMSDLGRKARTAVMGAGLFAAGAGTHGLAQEANRLADKVPGIVQTVKKQVPDFWNKSKGVAAKAGKKAKTPTERAGRVLGRQLTAMSGGR